MIVNQQVRGSKPLYSARIISPEDNGSRPASKPVQRWFDSTRICQTIRRWMKVSLQNKYPHIYNKLILLWGTEECRLYISELLKDTRKDTRIGFPIEVAQELMSILAEHDRLYPYLNVPLGFKTFKKYPKPKEVNKISIRTVLYLMGGILCLMWVIKNYILPN